MTGAAALGLQAAALDWGAGASAVTNHIHHSKTFLDILRPPDHARVFTDGGEHELTQSEGAWRWEDVDLRATPSKDGLAIALAAPKSHVQRVRLRWSGVLPTDLRVMGDHWERSYGDLEWRGISPERVLPWYCATHGGDVTHAYGVRTQPGAFCFWQIDSSGVTLWLDVRSGGVGVALGERTLEVCHVVSREGKPAESPHQALKEFCVRMCPAPRLPSEPIYGYNDWYSMYGNATQKTALAAAHQIVDLSPTGANRPFVVIDGGWQPDGGCEGDVWDHGKAAYPDMPGLAAKIQEIGGRPGIWVRPLSTSAATKEVFRLKHNPAVYDPTVPGTLEKVAADIARLRQWGYGLIKHDFSTFDILGRWGFAMGAQLTDDAWTFAEGPRRTNAEIISALYRTIRTAAGDGLLLGCNTVGHLSAGLFEMSRIGDDTSGQKWERTRRMGVNTLAFRAAQHDTFHAIDPDAVGLTRDVPWALNHQWLDLLARSGAAVFVSLPDETVTPEQAKALKAAFALAATLQPIGEPLDWMTTTCPEQWRFESGHANYQWSEPGGAWPFTV
ncbi:hypothetical protein CCAX7_21290 [Capsulimonas corticalis]|uniref:Alpha-galactosidase n=1 Tax=Capsulimonas corticalis TaxID=2219043 RepID=A0A9N7L376_9BACT|nr:hypothetical protein CCAX7_21290 [Capsulimonas corticalis]